jgi:phosphoserine phosphatase
METLFPLGQILATPGALEAADRAGENLFLFFFRHAAGDWGDLSREDLLANAQALKEGTRLLSAYHLKNGTKIWIITEWDRSATTLLLPEEY